MPWKKMNALGMEVSQSAPPEYLTGDEVAYVTNIAGQVVPAASNANITSCSFTLTGDGVNPILIEGYCYGVISSTAACDAELNIFDSATLIQAARVSLYTTGAQAPLRVAARIAPFTGTKTFILNGQTFGGSACTFQAGANSPIYMRAVRLRTVAQYAIPYVSLITPLISGSATLGYNIESIVTAWSVDSDPLSMYSAGLITIPQSGIYSIEAVLDMAAASATSMQGYIGVDWIRNGSLVTTYYGPTLQGSINASIRPIFEQIETMNLLVGDQLRLRYYQASSTAASRAFTTGVSGCRWKVQYEGVATTTPAIAGKELTGGYVTFGTISTGSTANGANSGAFTTMTITSDGLTPIMLEAVFPVSPFISATTVGRWDFNIWDGTIGTKLVANCASYPQGTANSFSFILRTRVLLSAGAHTLNLAAQNNSGGASTLTTQGTAGAGQTNFMRATWAG